MLNEVINVQGGYRYLDAQPFVSQPSHTEHPLALMEITLPNLCGRRSRYSFRCHKSLKFYFNENIQITDIHINKLFELTNNIKVVDNFIQVLDEGMAYQPDLIVLSGDLGHNDVQMDVYQWLKQQLLDRGVPF